MTDLERRLDTIEKRLDKLDARTASMIRLDALDIIEDSMRQQLRELPSDEPAPPPVPPSAPPPVDRTARILTSGAPVPEDGSHTAIQSNGQQAEYVVLTADERAKGFVRPLRYSYKHVGARPKYPTRELTAEEKERYAAYNYALYEEYPDDAPEYGCGRFWAAAQLTSGCGGITSMSRDIAATYARDPKFYSGTYCSTCCKHFPLEEFVWKGTAEIVGS